MSDHARAAKLKRRLGLLAIAGLVGIGTTGCTANEAFFFDMPDPASDQAETMNSLWQGAWVAAWPVGVLVWGLLIIAMLRMLLMPDASTDFGRSALVRLVRGVFRIAPHTDAQQLTTRV